MIRAVIFVLALVSLSARGTESFRVGDWYEVTELRPNVFAVTEPTHVTFFILRYGARAVFIDSGLGLHTKGAYALLDRLKVSEFDVLLTHAHPDHVGLNYIARSVYANGDDWIRHLDGELRKPSILYYHQAFAADSQWPPGLVVPPRQYHWTPKHFLKGGETLQFGPWKFRVERSAGHTVGHLSFYETSTDLYFTGDLVYDGLIFQQMPDSSLLSFGESLRGLATELSTGGDKLLLPSHNTIPLSIDYVSACVAALTKIEHRTLVPSRTWSSPNPFFLDAHIFEDGPVRIAVRQDDPMLVGER